MPSSSENGQDAVDLLEKEMMSFCNLIPVNSWGFDDDVKESLKMRKHSLVNRQLSKKERKSMSAQQKQHLAKGLGLVPNTVQEVLEWMSNSKQHSKVQPQKVVAALKRPVEKQEKKQKPEPKKQQKQEKEDSSDSEEEEEESSSDGEEGNDTKEPEAKKLKKEDSSDDEDEDDDEVEIKNDAQDDEDGDSTDEEDDEVPAKKSKLTPSLLKSNDKIDKEIKKLEDDEDNESPEIKRQIALLRLQKKLKEMKTERKGKGPAKVTPAMAAKLAEEKRLKRRESKLKLKQRRAEEKKVKQEASEVKTEVTENNENGDEEKKKSGISFNNLKFEIKEDKQRGKKQRTAKKDRALKLTGRDYKSLIAKVEETKATIAKVREADPHKATIMEDELKWEKTLKRAAGGKVKDNLEMLKKALAKKNKLKERKKEKWENREKKVDGEKQTVSLPKLCG
uniref:SURF6 domain-containing protein n=1 Tax=Caenorhabditis tropicalis TaxID=1561998 RepID=A0A1I7TS31_9PELO